MTFDNDDPERSGRRNQLPGAIDHHLAALGLLPTKELDCESRTAISPSIERIAYTVFNARRLRRRMFGASMFGGEGAWDILLALYVAELRGRVVSFEDLARVGGVSDTTAARWLDFLEAEGLAAGGVRASEPTPLRLTPVGRDMLDGYFRSVALDGG